MNAGASLTTKNSVGKQPINDATSLEMLMLLRNHGANLDQVDGCGDWPLKVAADRGELEIVSWLIDQGVEVNQPLLTTDDERRDMDAGSLDLTHAPVQAQNG